MRCPACNTYNTPTATTCVNCQASLPGKPRKARRTLTLTEVSDNPQTQEYNQRVKGIFQLWLWSLIPFVGLVLGPLSALLAWRLIRQARYDPAFTAGRGARMTMFLGLLTSTTNWLGLGLMVLGLYLRQ